MIFGLVLSSMFLAVLPLECLAQGKELPKKWPQVNAPECDTQWPPKPDMLGRPMTPEGMITLREPPVADRAGADCKTPVWEWCFVGACCEERKGPMCLECKNPIAG